jgi:small-conductance mechanosensitive channel/CRP-like cAMP-binding protein
MKEFFESLLRFVLRVGTLEDGLLLVSWLLFLFILAFTKKRPRLRVFRTPVALILLSATFMRLIVLLSLEHLAGLAATFYAFSIAYFISRVIVFVSFDMIIDRRLGAPTPALMKTLLFFGLLFLSLFILNESLPEQQRVPVGSLLASAAVISVVLGFALQDTLGNLFSGLALHLERPIQVGNWIKVGDSVGKVVEMDWRSIKLRTLSHDHHILPNSLIASQRIVNFGDPPTPHRRELIVRAPYSASPDNVISAILPILRNHREIEKEPAPNILVRNFSDFWIDYEVRYWYTDYQKLEQIDGEIRRQVWYHFRRDRIESPLPIRQVYQHDVKTEPQAREERLQEMEVRLRHIPIFEPISDAEFRKVLEGMHFALYAAGETIIRQSEVGDSFFVIYSGEAEVSVEQADGSSSVVKLLRRGDYFGEMALLTGERRTATITAIAECACYVVSKELFKQVLETNPAIAEKLSTSLGSRMAELTEQLSALEADRLARKKEKEKDLSKKILAKIKRYFGLE